MRNGRRGEMGAERLVGQLESQVLLNGKEGLGAPLGGGPRCHGLFASGDQGAC